MSTVMAPLATAEQLAKYEAVIGLEVHVQLGTDTKIFSAAPNAFGEAPNTLVTPICLAIPGTLPVLNKRVVEMAVKAGLALNCKIRPVSIFARKNYFYPDLPKGYQISQYDQPISEHGWVEIVVDGQTKRIGVTRAHLEEDAGKLVHEGFKDSARYSYVDLNRAGAPLVEIVSEPDIRTSDEAYAYLTELKLMLQFAEVSNCDMEKGQLRCDANVSVRPVGQKEFGTKAEIKNLNSFRYVKMAIDYEIARQVGLIEAGGAVSQETRLYNVASGETVSMRSKEHAHDYRYFPEPDLPPLKISEEWLARIAADLPELPAAKRERFIEQLGLREYDAQVLTLTRELSEYFEAAAGASSNPKTVANWVTGDLMGALKAAGKEIAECPVSAEHLGELVSLIEKGEISGKLAKEVFARMFETGDSAATVMEREGLKQISDSGELEAIVDGVIAGNPAQVEQYRGGKTAVIGFLVGQVMKASRGQANPQAVNEILRRKLSS
ncbi:MAG: Asp-tRNA(Asn)/Glu-tRNA(Gln) amidotransferase subunit GatB [Bryobacterales bacterium]|nr:Asp-tRNA(Asn)/Glu-tRNA(Gln) amidotransferase subunit GatB [Bryobacterales bacterium]